MVKAVIKLIQDRIKEEKEAAIERQRRISLGLPLDDDAVNTNKSNATKNGRRVSHGSKKKSPGKKKKKKKGMNTSVNGNNKRTLNTKENNGSGHNGGDNKRRKRGRNKDLRLDPNLVRYFS